MKLWRYVAIGSILVGIFFCCSGILIYKNDKEFMKTAKKTTAVIDNIYVRKDSNGNYNNDVYLEYEVNGKVYNEKSDFYNSSMRKGDKLKIYYNSKNPREISTGDGSLFGFVFVGIGCIVLIISGIGLKAVVKREKEIANLKKNGMIINAKIESIKWELLDSRYVYMLLCSYKEVDSDKTYIFRKRISEDIKSTIETNNIEFIPVYVDSENKSQYWIDTDSLKRH